MKYSFTLIVLLIFTSISNVYALKHIDINIKSPYSTGSLELRLEDGIVLNFSNGFELIIRFEEKKSTGISIPTIEYWYCFVLNGAYIETGFKDNNSIVKDSLEWNQINKYLIVINSANPDTVWENILKYPSKLHPLDLVEKKPYPKSMSKVFATNTIINDSLETWDMLENYKSIFYSECNDERKIACQFYNAKIDSTAKDTLRKIVLRWAADSSGNGTFQIPTTIHSNEQYFTKNRIIVKKTGEMKNLISVNNLKIKSISIFKLSGQKIFHRDRINSNTVDISSLKNGIYLTKINLDKKNIFTQFFVN